MSRREQQARIDLPVGSEPRQRRGVVRHGARSAAAPLRRQPGRSARGRRAGPRQHRPLRVADRGLRSRTSHCPAWARASSQLASAATSEPRCSGPVGEGAKRPTIAWSISDGARRQDVRTRAQAGDFLDNRAGGPSGSSGVCAHRSHDESRPAASAARSPPPRPTGLARRIAVRAGHRTRALGRGRRLALGWFILLTALVVMRSLCCRRWLADFDSRDARTLEWFTLLAGAEGALWALALDPAASRRRRPHGADACGQHWRAVRRDCLVRAGTHGVLRLCTAPGVRSAGQHVPARTAEPRSGAAVLAAGGERSRCSSPGGCATPWRAGSISSCRPSVPRARTSRSPPSSGGAASRCASPWTRSMPACRTRTWRAAKSSSRRATRRSSATRIATPSSGVHRFADALHADDRTRVLDGDARTRRQRRTVPRGVPPAQCAALVRLGGRARRVGARPRRPRRAPRDVDRRRHRAARVGSATGRQRAALPRAGRSLALADLAVRQARSSDVRVGPRLPRDVRLRAARGRRPLGAVVQCAGRSRAASCSADSAGCCAGNQCSTSS